MNTRKAPRELALDLLARSTCDVRVAAVLSDKHGIFAWGWNHPNVVTDDVDGIHAEQHAFRRANRRRLRGAKITVAGMRSNGRYVYSKPCAEICLPLCLKFGIGTIEFTGRDGSWIELKLRYVRVC